MRRPSRIDRIAPWAASALLFAALYTLALLRHYTIGGSFDLGYFRQAAWLIAKGRQPFVTIRGLHLLGDHASPIFYPMAWATRILPRMPFLLGLQSAALALTAVPLHAIGRRLAKLDPAPALVLVAAYALYPAVHNVNLADFHPEVVAVPALAGAFLFGMERRWGPYAACVAVILGSKEGLAFAVGALGLLLLLEGHRRPAAATVIAAGAVLVFDVRILIPRFAEGQYVHSVLYARYGSTMLEQLRTVLGRPDRVVADLATHQNFEVLVGLLAPLVFLPLLSPRHALPALPTVLLNFLSARPGAHTLTDQYTVGIIPFAFTGASFAMGGGGREQPSRTLLAALLISSATFHTVYATSSLAANPWEWARRDPVDRARLEAVRLVPPSAPVSATDRLLAYLAEREDVYRFPAPFAAYEPRKDPKPIEVRRRGVRWIVLDTADPVQWTDAELRALETVVPQQGFRKVFDRNGILVLRR